MYCTFEIITNIPIEKLENKKAWKGKFGPQDQNF